MKAKSIINAVQELHTTFDISNYRDTYHHTMLPMCFGVISGDGVEIIGELGHHEFRLNPDELENMQCVGVWMVKDFRDAFIFVFNGSQSLNKRDIVSFDKLTECSVDEILDEYQLRVLQYVRDRLDGVVELDESKRYRRTEEKK